MSSARAADGALSEPAEMEGQAALTLFGERFMSMFDDYDEHAAHAGPSSQAQAQAGGKSHKAKPKKGGGKQKDAQPFSATPAKAQPQAPTTSAATASEKRRRAASDEIDEILQLSTKKSKGGQDTAGTSGQHRSAVPVIDFSNRRLGAPGAQPSAGVDMKAARRAFMSHKAAKVHADPPPDAGAAAQTDTPDLDMTLSSEDFRQLALQVEKFGGAAIEDKKQRKQWKAQYLLRLGMTPEKSPKMAAKLGRNVAQKQAKEQAKALEEAIASGAVQVKGSAKKKAALRDANRDWGLQEAGPGFKGGVLRVKNPGAVARQAGPPDRMGPPVRKGKGAPRKGGGKGKGKGKGKSNSKNKGKGRR